MPVGGNLEEIIRDWANELRALGAPHDAPLFPKEFSDGVKSKDGSLSCWSNSDPVRRIAKAAFLNAGLDYFNPHSFRKAITRHFLGLNISIEEFLAISINLCHKSPMTTLKYYGTPTDDRRAQLIKNIGSKSSSDIGEHASAFLDELKKTRPRAQAKILAILSSPDTD
jgi:integrase